MNIEVAQPALFYSIFFTLAHLLSWGILFWFGHKHKYPKVKWMLIIVTGYISFTIGSHVIDISKEGLQTLFFGGIWPMSTGQSLISGLLFAIPAMLLVKYLLGFNRAIFEPYAFTIPLGIAIQRMGCLAAGCCYGKITNVPWRISYNFGHQIHYSQWKKDLITNPELQSIGIHPVQVYESILCLLIFALVIYIYKRHRMQNQLVYVFLLLYSVIRFITEIFRADEAHTIGVNNYFGLNTVQWIMIASFFLFLYILIKGKKTHQVTKKVERDNQILSFKDYVWYFLLFAIIMITPNLYSPLELLLLGVLFVPVSLLVFWQFFESITVPRLRFATVSLCVAGMFLMSQNSPVDKEDSTATNYHEISVGGYVGSNSMTHYTQSCSGAITKDRQFDEQYYLGGIGYKYINEIDNDKKLTAGIVASYGTLKENIDAINYSYDQNIYAFSPFVKYDLRKIGFGIGFSAGDISLYRPYDSSKPLTIFKRFSVLPQVHLRFGNLSKVWGEINYGFRFPGISPASEFELLLGIKGKKGNLVRVGISAYHLLVVRPQFNINNKFGIEPYVGFGGPLISNSYTDRNGFEGGLNLHYRIRPKKYR